MVYFFGTLRNLLFALDSKLIKNVATRAIRQPGIAIFVVELKPCKIQQITHDHATNHLWNGTEHVLLDEVDAEQGRFKEQSC